MGIKTKGFVGRSSSFEIYVNDHLIFSKLGAGFFPEPADVIAVLKHIRETGKMPEGAKKVDLEKIVEGAADASAGGCIIA
mmetsp:Transcript_13061/g.45666  ORF Transcript_13061/g.45666 Transcript_13061/m.45666 type:complete len:80 (-) Transcript_13061:405-644(-)